jgi:hypothetical protein
MADTTPPAGGSAPDKKPRKSPGPIDQKLADQLRDDHEIIDAALDEIQNDAQLAADLATHFLDAEQALPITPANVQALSDQATAAEQRGAQIATEESDFHGVTDTEQNADMPKAVAAVRKVQSAAKEKYRETNKAKLDSYYVGEPLKSRRQIENAATACWNMVGNTDENGNPVTPQDTLPGIGATQLAQIKTDLGGYVSVQTEQSGAQKKATDARVIYKTQCGQIQRRRRRLQQAFDTERPHGEANTALRRRVGLPANRAMI